MERGSPLCIALMRKINNEGRTALLLQGDVIPAALANLGNATHGSLWRVVLGVDGMLLETHPTPCRLILADGEDARGGIVAQVGEHRREARHVLQQVYQVTTREECEGIVRRQKASNVIFQFLDDADRRYNERNAP